MSAAATGTASTVVYKLNIGTVEGDLHIGPKMVQNLMGRCLKGSDDSEKTPKMRLDDASKKHIYDCGHSRRPLARDEIPLVAARMGSNWKKVGRELGEMRGGGEFSRPWANVLERFDAEPGWDMQEKTEKMLHRWIEWQCDEATVGRLTRALYRCHEVDAIAVLKHDEEEELGRIE